MGDDLFGSDYVVGYVDDGLRAGEGTAAGSKDTWSVSEHKLMTLFYTRYVEPKVPP